MKPALILLTSWVSAYSSTTMEGARSSALQLMYSWLKPPTCTAMYLAMTSLPILGTMVFCTTTRRCANTLVLNLMFNTVTILRLIAVPPAIGSPVQSELASCTIKKAFARMIATLGWSRLPSPSVRSATVMTNASTCRPS